MVAEGDDGLLRQILGGGREFRVDQRHIPVGAGEKRLVFERLAVLLQRFDQRLIGRFAPLLARDDGAQVLAQAGYPACARTCAPSSRASSGAKRPIRR